MLVLFYRPLRDHVVPHLTTLNVMGVELSFVRESMDRAIESARRHDAQMALAEKSKQWKVEVSPGDRERALPRARTHARLFQPARLLWVDDYPENNENERRMFRQLGADIGLALTTEEARYQAARGSYDLVISDMERGDDRMAGLRLAAQIQQKGMKIRVVLCIGVLDASKGVPPFVFGITNRPDELLHWFSMSWNASKNKSGSKKSRQKGTFRTSLEPPYQMIGDLIRDGMVVPFLGARASLHIRMARITGFWPPSPVISLS